MLTDFVTIGTIVVILWTNVVILLTIVVILWPNYSHIVDQYGHNRDQWSYIVDQWCHIVDGCSNTMDQCSYVRVQCSRIGYQSCQCRSQSHSPGDWRTPDESLLAQAPRGFSKTSVGVRIESLEVATELEEEGYYGNGGSRVTLCRTTTTCKPHICVHP